jgi:uncharacterized protein (DUF58 family)
MRAVPGARLIDPVVLSRIGNLELVARHVVEGFITGLHHSPNFGLSVDFAEHRPYMPGDDIRRIDWRVYARTDRHYIKQFEADTNTDFTVVLDTSASMGFASQGISKFDYARYLAACLLYMSGRQRDRVGLALFSGTELERIPPGAKHLDLALHALDRAQTSGSGTLLQPLRKLSEHMRRRSIVAVISDFYEEATAVTEAVRQLRQRGNDVIVFHILDRAELDDPRSGKRREAADCARDVAAGIQTDDFRARRGYRQAYGGARLRLHADRHGQAARPRIVPLPVDA